MLSDNYCLQDESANIREVKLDLSIGAVIYPTDATSAEELVAKADKAMYHAKTNKLPYALYSDAELTTKQE
ncbi:diguanylate cyclase domain-containing protein [Pseudoalteromonas piscicida]|uniref:diguanylate cyclase domain-containing protein n=1 Tax=Pseudoalteromonas piscicida TaxID=43662 RepID=UPI00202AE676|nr:diguanylate cyclase [Pseudoalteromonas piscicida]